jgi:hypothetical protein
MPETVVTMAPVETDVVLDLAYSRLPCCPLVSQPDLAACLGYLRSARGGSLDKAADLAQMDRYYVRAITRASKGLDRREDRALSLMVMVITALRDNTPQSNAQALRTIRQIRMPVRVS